MDGPRCGSAAGLTTPAPGVTTVTGMEPQSPPATAPTVPVLARNRIAALDALRGAALLGVLLVNTMQSFAGPDYGLEAAGQTAWSPADRATATVLTAVALMKFVSAFAFLFGVGLALQGARADARGGRSGPLLVRRLLVLGVFGLLHAVLVWSGDILLTYALVGLVAVTLRRSRPGVLLGAAGAALFLVLLFTGLTVVGSLILSSTGDAAAAGLDGGIAALPQRAAEVYASGDYGAMVAQRLDELAQTLGSLVVVGPWVLALIWAGMAATRSGLVERLEERRSLLRRLAVAGVAVGLPLNVVAALGMTAEAGALSPLRAGAQLLLFIAAPLLTAGYLAAGALWLTRHPDAAAARALAAVGRMAFTSYLLQSVVMTAVFYGLGLYGRVALLPALALALAVYAGNVAVAAWWLGRFPMGPAEWLWRRLTYPRTTTA